MKNYVGGEVNLGRGHSQPVGDRYSGSIFSSESATQKTYDQQY